MLLTKHTDLSLRVLMHLSLQQGEMSTVKEVAEKYHVSQNHLVKVVHTLASLGYIQSIQGRGGGIKLAEKTANVSVGEIVRVMENTLEVFDCVGSNCPIAPSCILSVAVNEATHAFLQVLDNYEIRDLVTNRSQLLKLIS